MAEFNIVEFTELLREYLYGFFPYEDDDTNIKRHPKRPLHIRDIAFMYLPYKTDLSRNMITFDIGSDYAEEYYPYYHILQDAPYIRKRNRSSVKTGGSQAKVMDLKSRDYGRVRFNGKTYSKEYDRNVRGERKKITDHMTKFDYKYGKTIKIERDTNSYPNIHYKYIDNILDIVVPQVAIMYGGIYVGKHGTSLAVDYQAQELANWLEESIDSTDFDYDYGDELWEHLQ